MTENRNTPVPSESTDDREDPPACPACGETWLYNVQEVEEGRQFRVLTRGPFNTYELARVDWTIHVENNLVCAECEWSAPMGSPEAEQALA